MLAHKLTLVTQTFYNPVHTEIYCAGAASSLSLSTKNPTLVPGLKPLSIQQILQRSRSSTTLKTCCQDTVGLMMQEWIH